MLMKSNSKLLIPIKTNWIQFNFPIGMNWPFWFIHQVFIRQVSNSERTQFHCQRHINLSIPIYSMKWGCIQCNWNSRLLYICNGTWSIFMRSMFFANGDKQTRTLVWKQGWWAIFLEKVELVVFLRLCKASKTCIPGRGIPHFLAR